MGSEGVCGFRSWRSPALVVGAGFVVWVAGGRVAAATGSVALLVVLIAGGVGVALSIGIWTRTLKAVALTAVLWAGATLFVYVTAEPTCPGFQTCSGEYRSSWNSAIDVGVLGLVLCLVTTVGVLFGLARGGAADRPA